MGFLYCFTTVGDANIVKVGHTQQSDPSSRFRGYLGPSKPRVVIAQRPVEDSERAEADMLRLCRECKHLTPRLDYGPEWFEIVTDKETCHSALLFFATLATQPSRNRPTNVVYHGAEGRYRSALHKFVVSLAPAESFASPSQLLDAFEQHDVCPVFGEYVSWSRALRLQWAAAECN